MDEKNEDSIGYEFKGKFMISSVGLLFLACVIIILFHVYYRWFRRRHLLLYHRSAASTAMTGSQGLEFSAVNSLPTFIYQSKNHEPPPECAVCLSEFEHNETGRILPECNHWFHIECIDMWLLSHCDCPICRARVKAADPVEEEIITVSISAPGSDSPSDETDTGCSSSSSPDVSTIPMGRDPTKNEKDPDPVTNIGPDIESGSNLPCDSVQVQVQVRALKSFS